MNQEEIILACAHCAPEADKSVSLRDGRKVACCCECWNLSVAARREVDRAQLAADKQAGREYWSQRSISVGETVVCCGMGVFGPFRIEGMAKIGKRGAYVTSAMQRGQLHPAAFTKAL